MHELSIVLSIIDIARNQARRAEAERVERIELDIGQLAGVEWDALDFAWKAAVPGTILADAERLVHRIPGRAKCLECGSTFDLQQLYDPCPNCSSPFNELLSGKELRVKALTVC